METRTYILRSGREMERLGKNEDSGQEAAVESHKMSASKI